MIRGPEGLSFKIRRSRQIERKVIRDMKEWIIENGSGVEALVRGLTHGRIDLNHSEEVVIINP